MPAASHHGGVGERQVRTIRKILQAMLIEQHLKGARNEEQLTSTLLCEVENTINSRPLTVTSDDPQDLNPITPNHLLQLRTPENYPPGKFIKQRPICASQLDEDKFSSWQMCFGNVGQKSIFLHYNKGRNG